MKILDITSRLPYPLIDGASIVMFQLIEGLKSRGHDLTVVALDEERNDPGPLAGLASVHVVELPKVSRAGGALRTLFDRRPFTQIKRDRPEVYRLLDRLQQENDFDVVIADQAHVSGYGAWMKKRHGVPYLLRSHNVEHEIWRRQLVTITNPAMRRYVALQTERWERFEREQIAACDVCVAITERDQEAISRMVPGVAVATIPAAVDLEKFPFVDPSEREDNSMIMLGNMGWPPNRNSVLWFAREIYPRIQKERPDAICHIVGDNPPVADLPASETGFRIEGRVEDIAPWYGRIAVGLIPLNVGGGMRVKMVEMMSSGMPIVSTGQGAEGNLAIPGEHYLRGDSPEEFASAVVRLLGDPALRRRLAHAAREFVCERYSAENTSGAIEELLCQLIGQKKHA